MLFLFLFSYKNLMLLILYNYKVDYLVQNLILKAVLVQHIPSTISFTVFSHWICILVLRPMFFLPKTILSYPFNHLLYWWGLQWQERLGEKERENFVIIWNKN
jgi:hypothetical protein